MSKPSRPAKPRPTSGQRGYGANWQKRRAAWLVRQYDAHIKAHPEHAAHLFEVQPPCAECLTRGVVRCGKVVDHIIPHKGDKRLFWDEKNWRALCVSCHSRKTNTTDGGFGNRPKAR